VVVVVVGTVPLADLAGLAAAQRDTLDLALVQAQQDKVLQAV
jgi:hypothetical protein